MCLMWSWKVIAVGLMTISATVCAFSTSQSSCNARDLSLHSLSSKTASFCSTRDIPFTTANSLDSFRGGSGTTRPLREHLGVTMKGDLDLYIVGAGYLGYVNHTWIRMLRMIGRYMLCLGAETDEFTKSCTEINASVPARENRSNEKTRLLPRKSLCTSLAPQDICMDDVVRVHVPHVPDISTPGKV